MRSSEICEARDLLPGQVDVSETELGSIRDV